MRKVLPGGADVLAVSTAMSKDLLDALADDKLAHTILRAVLASPAAGGADEREEAESLHHRPATLRALKQLQQDRRWYSPQPTEADARQAVLARFVPELAKRVRTACDQVRDLDRVRRVVDDLQKRALPLVASDVSGERYLAVSDKRLERITSCSLSGVSWRRYRWRFRRPSVSMTGSSCSEPRRPTSRTNTAGSSRPTISDATRRTACSPWSPSSRSRRLRKRPASTSAGALWNTLVMVARARTLWELACERLRHLTPYFSVLQSAIGTPREARVLDEVYETMPRVNFSSDLLERASDRIAMQLLDGVMWNDRGQPARIVESLLAVGRQPAFRPPASRRGADAAARLPPAGDSRRRAGSRGELTTPARCRP